MTWTGSTGRSNADVARLMRERFAPPLAAPASALTARTTVGGMETPYRSLHLTWAHIVVGWSIRRIWDVRWSIHHIRHVRRFRRGIQLYGGQSRPFGCACGQRGCCPRRTRFNYARGDKCPDHCSDGCNQASDGSQHPRKCSPKSDGWLFFAHGSNPSMRERNADRRTDESEREHSTSRRLVWRANPPDGQLTDHPEGGGTRDDRAQQDRSHDVFLFAAGIGANTVRSRIPARPVRLRCGRVRTAIPSRRCRRPAACCTESTHRP